MVAKYIRTDPKPTEDGAWRLLRGTKGVTQKTSIRPPRPRPSPKKTMRKKLIPSRITDFDFLKKCDY